MAEYWKLVVDTIQSPSSIAWIGVVAALLTAVATVMLWRATRQLVLATNVLAEQNSNPSVIATIEPHAWAPYLFDLRLANEGNATAFDVELSVDPSFTPNEARRVESGPFGKVSVLRPKQVLRTLVGKFDDVKGKVFTVNLIWKGENVSNKVYKTSYVLNMSYYEGVTLNSFLSPEIQTAQEIKKIRESLDKISPLP